MVKPISATIFFLSRSHSFPINKVFLALLLSQQISSCGRDDSSKHDLVRRRTISMRPPVTYELHDPNCQSEQYSIDIDKAAIWQWQGLQVAEQFALMSETKNTLSLNSNAIAKTQYGRTFSRTCTSASQSQCLDDKGQRQGFQIQKVDQLLRVCRNAYRYPRDSYEAAALTATFYLNQAREAYVAASGESIDRTTLEVFPLFETLMPNAGSLEGELVDHRYWQTDNAAYIPVTDAVVIFPQSQGFQNVLDRLWESGFVLSHEYGHKVQAEVLKPYQDKLSLYWSPLLHRFVSNSSVSNVSDSIEQADSLMMTSVSEAFADLIGYYTLRGDITSLQNIHCLGAQRNMRDANFNDSDQTPKILRQQDVQSLLNAKPVLSSCSVVDFGDPHTVGAVFAHTLHGVFEIASPDDNANDKSQTISQRASNTRYRLTLRWLQEYTKEHLRSERRIRDAENLFAPIMPAIENSLQDISLNSEQKQKICQLTSKNLPFLSSQPFLAYCK